MSIRVATTSLGATALFALALGCQNAAEKQVNERAEARKEIDAAGQDAQTKIETARGDLQQAEEKFGEKVGEAQKEIADETREGGKEIGEADRDASKAMMEARYPHFKILENESESAFASRAEAAITRLQTDLDTAIPRSRAAGATKEIRDSVDAATTALEEAKKDLVELRGKNGKPFDDGRIGVGLAINKAQRKLNDAHEAMAAAKM